MTPEGKENAVAAAPEGREQDQQTGPSVYEPPALIALGNVHALLAGTGASPVLDSNKVGMRNGSG